MATTSAPPRSADLNRSLAESLFAFHVDDYRGSVLPIRRLTRDEIEHQLDQDCAAEAQFTKQLQDRSVTLDTQSGPITKRHVLKTFPIEPLFPAAQPQIDVNGAPSPSRHPLKLVGYRPWPLYSNETPLAPPGSLSITLDPNEYVAKRRKVYQEMETMRQQQHTVAEPPLVSAQPVSEPSIRSTVVEPQDQQRIENDDDMDTYVEDILREVLEESLPPTPPRPPLTQAPPVPQRPAIVATTTTTAQQENVQHPVVATQPQQQLAQRTSYPEGWVPVFPTLFQQQKCDELRQAAEQDPSNYKPIFLDTIGSLNHPLVAMVDDYHVTADDKWEGSGKTKFLRDFIWNLCEAEKELKVAVVAFDINNEGFLFDEIRNDLGLPCMRIGSVLDENWEREYGVLLMTSSEPSDDFRQPTADIIIAFDIRIRPKHNVFQKIRRRDGAVGVPPTVWLVTAGSLEDRAATYSSADVSHADYWKSNWWSTDPGYQNLLLAENVWPSQTVSDSMRSEVLASVMTWARAGFAGQYQFIIPGSAPAPAEAQQQQDIPTTSSVDAGPQTTSDADSTLPPPPTTTTTPPPDLTAADLLAQVKQLFRYSPLFSPREPLLSVRDDDDDDDSVSFHSANEFIDTEVPGLKSRISNLQTEYQNQCLAIKARLQQQYTAEMEALKQAYEQKALEKIRNTPL